MNKVRWGVLSTANIGTGKVIPAMQKGKYIQFDAIASRNLEKGKAVAAQLGIPRAYGSYEELLADPNIDAIYNPLPNHLHVPWSIKALEAGKHVLCEKPIALTSAEAQQLADAAKQYPHLKVMEAFMYRFQPQWQHTRHMVNEGKIGELRTIQSFFSYYLDDANNIRNIAEAGGGGMMDIGCYTVSLSRYIFGTTGRIEIEIPFNAPPDQPCKIWYQNGDEIEEILFDICNQYTLQGDQFSQAILNNTSVPTPIEDAVANMKVIEAIIRSAKSGTWA